MLFRSVAKEFVDIEVEFEEAISIEEEQAAIRAAEEARRAEEEQRAAEAERKRQQAAQSSSSKSSSSSSSKSSSSSNSSSSSSSSSSSNSGTVIGSSDGAKIANFALKFVGNKYVYGGTSLTNGADCSGFTQSVFKNFGISIPRTSGAQSGTGKAISVGDAKAGDLIFYSAGGRVNHVALCIGGGKVVHASTSRTGIIVSNM